MSKIKIEKKIRNKWLKSLRSGEYSQIDGNLYDSSCSSYCCIGVLGRNLGIDTETLDGVGDPASPSFPFDLTCKFPKALIQYNKRSKKKKTTKFCNTLIDMNDNDNKSFKEIADYIEDKTIGV